MQNSLIITEPSQLQAIVTTAIHEALKGFNQSDIQGTPNKSWLNGKEVQTLLNCSSRTLQHLRDSRQIEFSQHGRKIYYPIEGINQYMSENLIKRKGNK